MLTVANVAPESAASYYELFPGDVVLQINNLDAVHSDVVGAKRLSESAGDYLELLVARADVGGLTEEANAQLQRNPNSVEAARGVDGAAAVMFDPRFVAGGEGPRYAEEYHFPASGYYEDE